MDTVGESCLEVVEQDRWPLGVFPGGKSVKGRMWSTTSSHWSLRWWLLEASEHPSTFPVTCEAVGATPSPSGLCS